MVLDDVLDNNPVCPVCGSENIQTDPPDGSVSADLVCAECGARTFADDPDWYPLDIDSEE